MVNYNSIRPPVSAPTAEVRCEGGPLHGQEMTLEMLQKVSVNFDGGHYSADTVETYTSRRTGKIARVYRWREQGPVLKTTIYTN
jgi:hypothetical protein